MSKYIIEAGEEANLVQIISVTQNGNAYTDTEYIGNLEELNSDYINEHFGDLQDTAYQKGPADAWECARKLSWTEKYGGYGERWDEIFGRTDFFDIFDCTPNEAIEKLKAYEKKQDDEIKVGDEVRWCMDLIVVTRLHMDGGFKWCDGISKDGRAFHVLEESVSKTGRHFDIEGILREMRE